VEAGARLYTQLGCATCHNPGSGQLGPYLARRAGPPGQTGRWHGSAADDEYLRESILNSQAKIVAGFAPVMPVVQGHDHRGSDPAALIAYIKSLTPAAGGTK
jgi:cytochrome c oxidase subunit 2